MYKDQEKTMDQFHQSVQKAIQMARNRICKQKMKDQKKTAPTEPAKKAVKYFYYDWDCVTHPIYSKQLLVRFIIISPVKSYFINIISL